MEVFLDIITIFLSMVVVGIVWFLLDDQDNAQDSTDTPRSNIDPPRYKPFKQIARQSKTLRVKRQQRRY